MFSSFFALSITQKKVFIEAWYLFLIWDWRIRRRHYAAWQASVFGERNTGANAAVNVYATEMVPIIEKAGKNHVRKMNCLRRCLVTRQMLEKRGIYTILHFGVRIAENRQTNAHCWLTHNGKLINDGEEVVSTYTELRPKQDKQDSLIKALS